MFTDGRTDGRTDGHQAHRHIPRTFRSEDKTGQHIEGVCEHLYMFSSIFTKGDNFRDCLLAFVDSLFLPK